MKQASSSLLDNCTSGGCGAKIGAGELSKLLAGLPVLHDENLIVGYDSSDDAAVYKISDKSYIVATADFFPPMVNDPMSFGKIAAANALSDIYAMGGKPITALNLVCFPQSMDMGILREILQGGAEKVAEASAVLAGGHSIYDKEPKYGLAVTGIVENDKIIKNDTPAIGHKLILTKPLGTGLVIAALRGGVASTEAVDKAVATMERLNKYAAEKMQGFCVSACTDITGFGLLAHALEMASDKVSIALYPSEIPYIKEAYQYADEYLVTAAGQRNRNHLEGKADVNGLPFALQELMFDPQTSGGLLICVSSEQSDDLLAAIQADDLAARIIGEVVKRESKIILFQ
ncbi:MAG: selenide, water dikinase SelD [Oscillospiraceae bacterium]|nr:selenide, water dikinase SelD [Oscillospiraceae bacterium]